MALKLKQMGITRVRPLEGGFFGWRNRGFPLTDFYASTNEKAAVGK